MPLHDFECECGHVTEEVVSFKTKKIDCPECGAKMSRVFLKAATVCTAMVPTYPGCKKSKAGYTHTSHADQDATKIQSGYGGCQGPK